MLNYSATTSFIPSVQRLIDGLTRESEKKLSIESLKALRATIFKGTTNPTDAKKWLSLIVKCFGVMECHEERKC